MATSVLDLDLQKLPDEIEGLDNYEHAFVLLRFQGIPIGTFLMPLDQGRLKGSTIRQELSRRQDFNLYKTWLQAQLGWKPESHMGEPLPPATVVVCTRDRPDDLRRCLDGLMQLPDDGQEFLVIDNAPSTDATRRLVAEYDRVRYVLEERPGLDVARNRGVQEATHAIVAFTDDDATPDPGWLRALLQNFRDPLVMVSTGLILPLELETYAQECFELYSPMGKGFHRKVFDGTCYNPLLAGHVGAGASMALRKEIVAEVGYFDEALDCGTVTRSGGDHEMFARILAAGYRIVYDPAALCWHRHRRTWEDLRKTFYGYGVGVYAYWTCCLVRRREFGVLLLAWQWFWLEQLPKLLKALLHRSSQMPLELMLAELQGCMQGPWAYFESCRKVQQKA